MNRMPVGAQSVLLALMWVRASWSRRSASRWLSVVQVLARMASGALALLAICAVRRQPLPRDRAVRGHLLVVTMLL